MTGFESKRQMAQNKLDDDSDTLLIVYQRGFADGRMSAQQQAEPIGWLDGNDKLAYFMHRDLKADHDKRGSATPREYTIPVYAAPPQQQAEPTCPDCKAAVLYECVACSSNNYPPKQQAEPVVREGFNDWWNGDYDDSENRFEKDSAAYWAWAGWQAAQRKELSASEILNMMPSQIPSEYDGELMQFARAVEAKLKERNGY